MILLETSGTEMLILIIVAALILIGITRFVYRINERVKMQQMQLKISILIAKKLGVSSEDINDALKDS